MRNLLTVKKRDVDKRAVASAQEYRGEPRRFTIHGFPRKRVVVILSSHQIGAAEVSSNLVLWKIGRCTARPREGIQDLHEARCERASASSILASFFSDLRVHGKRKRAISGVWNLVPPRSRVSLRILPS